MPLELIIRKITVIEVAGGSFHFFVSTTGWQSPNNHVFIRIETTMAYHGTQSVFTFHFFKQNLYYDFVGKRTQWWNESRSGRFSTWQKWKWLSLSILQRNQTAMARFRSFYTLQLIEQESWRTSRAFPCEMRSNTCCPRAQIASEMLNITSSCEMEILIRQNHDDNPTVHFPIFSNRGEKRAVWKKVHCTVWFPRTCSVKIQPWIGFNINWIYTFTKQYMETNTGLHFTRDLSWYSYVGLGMYISKWKNCFVFSLRVLLFRCFSANSTNNAKQITLKIIIV